MSVTRTTSQRWHYLAVSLFCVSSSAAFAQGTVRGTVTTPDGSPAPGASIHVIGTVIGTVVDSSGRYRIGRIPAGSRLIRVSRLGFAPDSQMVMVRTGAVTEQSFQLRVSPLLLGDVVVKAQRLGETEASAIQRRAEAPNIVNVLAGDVIRALPNANAAEAAGHMPGVSTERDEGEGKFIQIRGTEPRLSNVTIDGAHVPGTTAGSRVPKLDDIPSDLLGAIEVSKTLTADMDADAIGGSVNLVTKTPEGPPRGYISAQYGDITLGNKYQLQGGFAYGGRFGADQQLGLLLGASVDHNNRRINDLEPSWAVDNTGRSYPVEWNQRDYAYRRNRYGLGGDIDYRFSNGSAISLKGMFSRLEDLGTTYYTDLVTNGDSAGVGARGYGTGAQISQIVGNRTPRDQVAGGTLSGRTQWGSLTAKLTMNAAATKQVTTNDRFSPFTYEGPALTVAYDASDRKAPSYSFASPAMVQAAVAPSNFLLSSYYANDLKSTGRDLGSALDLSSPWHTSMDASWSSMLRFGGKIRDETKRYARLNGNWQTDTPVPLAGVLGSFSDPQYYSAVRSGFAIGPMGNEAATERAESAAGLVNVSDTVQNFLASLSGSERIYAAYVSNTVSAGPVEVYLGLRLENTRSTYIGHAVTQDTSGAVTGVSTVPGSRSYTDLFPSAQVKYALSPETDARIAVTRAIARPDYSSLAPSLQGIQGGNISDPGSLTVGNPDLRPQHAWNYDLLVEHFFPSVGVLSGGLFYKSLTDFIFNQAFTYNGPITTFVGHRGMRPENGGSGYVAGVEAEWTQRFVFLPGVLAGLGFDGNYTHTQSRVLVDPTTGRHASLQRQSPNLANLALTYDNKAISARLGWAYEGANIYAYGDGSATANGDNYMYAHSQVDGSLMYNFSPQVQLQLQALNLNNAVFGFFNGTPKSDFSVQREYYGRTIYLGAKYSF